MKDKESSDARRAFDYQERWHGWGSPVGLGIFLLSVSGGLFLFFTGVGVLVANLESLPQ
ncbi:hypothetical protein [Pontimonas sp.]|jgi:uncharacterized integral membrane protein|uniref:hypothetical protein n=1 Tax=Pontimonas sp. TaxID=2304492 RepID=UPI0028708B4E|nr:hypothetical protein [Pontimonas sp.]MDR9397183.1 hypothetical protein [Pontimonas sp.]MDR9435049.1 hypothetical protein [Pontimonas sp.]